MGIGFGAVAKAVEKSESRGSAGNFLNNIFWNDDRKGKGENYQKVVRFLTDDVVVAKFYEYVQGGKPNKDGKQFKREFIDPDSIKGARYPAEGDDPNKPDQFTGDLVFPELEGMKDYFKVNNVRLPNFKGEMKNATDLAVERTVGLAVLREITVTKVDGKRVETIQDKLVKRTWTDKEGTEHEAEAPVYGLVRQSNKNFWNTLAGYWNKYDTICDRDYEITRNGNDKDTSYVIIPCDKDPELATQEQRDAHYDPPMSLRDWVVKAASYDEVEKWIEWDGKGSSSTTSATTTSDDDESEDERTVEAPKSATNDELKAKLLGYQKTQ